MRPYSNDLRVVGSVERDELSRRQAASHYGVGASTVVKWVQRLRRTGSVSPGKMGRRRPKSCPAYGGAGCWSVAVPANSPCGVWWVNWPSVG
jgi:transposase